MKAKYLLGFTINGCKMKIALIANDANSVLNFRKEFILCLKKHSEVFVLAPQDDKKIIAQINALGAQFIPITLSKQGINPLKDLLFFKDLLVKVKNIRPDQVFSFTIKPVIWGSMAAKKAGVPFIYSMITGVGFAFTDITTAGINLSK